MTRAKRNSALATPAAPVVLDVVMIWRPEGLWPSASRKRELRALREKQA